MSTERIDIKCYLSDGNSFTTGFNGDYATAFTYFFEGTYVYPISEKRVKIIKVEQLP